VAEGAAAGAGEEASTGAGAGAGEGEAGGRDGGGESEEAQELDDASLKLLAPHLVQGSMRTGTGTAGLAQFTETGQDQGASSVSASRAQAQGECVVARPWPRQGAPAGSVLGPPLDPSQTFEDVLARFSPQHHLNNVQIRYRNINLVSL